MFRSPTPKALLLTLFISLFLAVPALALSIQPVIIDLLSNGRRAATVMTVENSFGAAVPVELSIHQIDMVDGVLTPREVESDDLLVFPSQAIIEPGGAQAFRVQWLGDPALEQSRHYYVRVMQMPVDLPQTQNAVQVLHTFNALVSVSAPGAKANIAVVSSTIEATEDGKFRPVVTVRNSGGAHEYVGRRRITIKQYAPNGDEIFNESFGPADIQTRMGLGLVPAGQERHLPINLDLPQGVGSVVISLSDSAVR